jgi:hypothetical protein
MGSPDPRQVRENHSETVCMYLHAKFETYIYKIMYVTCANFKKKSKETVTVEESLFRGGHKCSIFFSRTYTSKFEVNMSLFENLVIKLSNKIFHL